MDTTSRTCTSCHAPVPVDAAFCSNCGAATPTQLGQEVSEDSDPRLKAALADRYTIERELGRGGMAVVFLAKDLKHERQVAVKVMRPELAASLGGDRFLREIRIAARLQHQNILALYDSGESDGFLYYVMPFVEGESLRDKLKREKQLRIDEAVQLTCEVCDGLGYAHEQGIVHRDIKPENILLSGKHASIADFGIARALSDAGGARLTETGLTVGTPSYLSPEQGIGDRPIDGRADIYALGCVLYEMLGGDPPYVGSSPQAVLARKVVEPVPSLRVIRETVPEALEQVVMKALARVPADRFQTASDFAAALVAGPAVPQAGPGRVPLARRATPTVPPIRSRAFAAWLRRRWWLAGVLVGLVIGLIAFGPWGGAPRMTRPRVVVGFIRNQTGDPRLERIGDMAAQTITEGLVRTGVVDAVAPLAAQQAAQGISTSLEDGRIADPVAALGEATSAPIVVSGSYFREGEQLLFHLQVTDVGRDSLLTALEPVAGASDAPAEVVEDLWQRVAGVLALLFDERVVLPPGAALHAPTYDAYREFSRGLDAYRRFEIADARQSFVRASGADSAFVLSKLFAAMCAMEELQTNALVLDSLVTDLERQDARLTEYERQWVAYFREELNEDREAAYRAMAKAAAMAPGSRAELWLGRAALRINRPAEAFTVFERLDPEREPLRGWLPYWVDKTTALHMLGDHTRELAVAREARRSNPGDILALQLEAKALAALGRVAEVERVFDEAETLVSMTDEVAGMVARRQPDLLRVVGEELRAHGNREAGVAAFERALQWYDRYGDLTGSAQVDEARQEAAQWGDIYWRGVLLYNAERPREALRFMDVLLANQLAAADTGAPGAAERMLALGVHWSYSNIGVAAALAGDTARADEALRMLYALADALASDERPSLSRRVARLRTRVLARLARREEALRAMRESRRNGETANPWMHAAIDFEPLRGDPEFEAFLRPRG